MSLLKIETILHSSRSACQETSDHKGSPLALKIHFNIILLYLPNYKLCCDKRRSIFKVRRTMTWWVRLGGLRIPAGRRRSYTRDSNRDAIRYEAGDTRTYRTTHVYCLLPDPPNKSNPLWASPGRRTFDFQEENRPSPLQNSFCGSSVTWEWDFRIYVAFKHSTSEVTGIISDLQFSRP